MAPLLENQVYQFSIFLYALALANHSGNTPKTTPFEEINHGTEITE
jgi:hypothetical protein